MKKEVKVAKEIKESILARLGTMDAENLEKVLGFLKELEKQKEQKQGVD